MRDAAGNDLDSTL